MQIDLRLDRDMAWLQKALKYESVIDPDQVITVSYVPHAMASGAPAVAIQFLGPLGRHTIMQMSVKMLLTMAAGVRGRAEHDGLIGYAPVDPGALPDN